MSAQLVVALLASLTEEQKELAFNELLTEERSRSCHRRVERWKAAEKRQAQTAEEREAELAKQREKGVDYYTRQKETVLEKARQRYRQKQTAAGKPVRPYVKRPAQPQPQPQPDTPAQ